MQEIMEREENWTL